MITIGLTGSIGMGKTEVARMLKDLKVPVFDADDIVHDLYLNNTSLIKAVAQIAPSCLRNGALSREKLAEHIAQHPEDLAKLEQLIHPLVRRRMQEIIAQQRKQGAEMLVFSAPLLFESGMQDMVEVIMVVSSPLEVQKERVLKRPNMTPEILDVMLKNQIPNEIKVQRADFVLDTNQTLQQTQEQLRHILQHLRSHPSASKPNG